MNFLFVADSAEANLMLVLNPDDVLLALMGALLAGVAVGGLVFWFGFRMGRQSHGNMRLARNRDSNGVYPARM